MRPNIIIAAFAVVGLLLVASVHRGGKPIESRKIVIYLNEFGQVTRVDNQSGLSGLDVSGINVTRK